ncbi:hypothetical protein HPB47_025793 [Ixodes persulcatus]|uniref:Uncharacterized protein n=1 Tax=Ixodes persulcatus TaxID=34615 RepID=A0AC60Q2U9_IXOPE|nr:hypothetical protein HPB47_025793 [Ixodes persulcatus]
MRQRVRQLSEASVLTSFWASGVRSPLGRCSSSASTMQLAMMVSSTAYSSGVPQKTPEAVWNMSLEAREARIQRIALARSPALPLFPTSLPQPRGRPDIRAGHATLASCTAFAIDTGGRGTGQAGKPLTSADLRAPAAETQNSDAGEATSRGGKLARPRPPPQPQCMAEKPTSRVDSPRARE